MIHTGGLVLLGAIAGVLSGLAGIGGGVVIDSTLGNAIPAGIRNRVASIEVVLTGRGASQELIDYADLVTEMVPRKHPFDSGIPARIGIEY